MIVEAEQHSMALWGVFGRYLLGCALGGLDQPEAALVELERGREEAASLEHRILQPMTLCFEGQALAALGRSDDGLKRLKQALRFVEETQERWWEPDIHRVMGLIMLEQGRSPEACDAAFRRSVEAATQQGSKLLALRAEDTWSATTRRKSASAR